MAKLSRNKERNISSHNGNSNFLNEVVLPLNIENNKAILMVVIVTLVSLLPFVTKAFNIDEPVFLWTARHIQSNPLDFYGFKVNWYGFEMDMFSVAKNPPLVSYYIALITSLFGWSETVLHLFFLVPAVGLSLGTYFLAHSFCSSPILAAILTVFSPVFLVSSTSVMSDTMMLAFYVWAIFLWLEGLKNKSLLTSFISVIFIALSTLTKYFGATLIPLLFVFTLVEKRKFDYRLCTLIIPVLLIIGYELLTYNLYNQGLFSNAAAYASESWVTKPSQFLGQTLTGLSFTGGCLLGLTFFVPILWPRRALFLAISVLLILLISILLSNAIGDAKLYGEMESLDHKTGVRWGLVLQLALFISAGIHILILAITDLMRYRDASSLLLFLWVIGTFLFSSYINWTISARNIFPMLPAAAILVVRRINCSYKEPRTSLRWPVVLWPLLPAALISFLVTGADFSLANSQRSAAHTIGEKLRDHQLPVTFQGHWGFQYYMEFLGYKAVDFRMKHSKGDIVVIPLNNSNLARPKRGLFTLTGQVQEQPLGWLSVMKREWAGFYSSLWGPLPFAIGEVPPQKFLIFSVN